MLVNEGEQRLAAAGHGTVLWSASASGRPICAVWCGDGVRRYAKADTAEQAIGALVVAAGIPSAPPPPPPETGRLSLAGWERLRRGEGL